MLDILDLIAVKSAKVVNMVLVARRRVNHVQIMLFVTSRQESARGLVPVLLDLLVPSVKICASLVTGEWDAIKLVPRLAPGKGDDVTQLTENADVSLAIEDWSVNLIARWESTV